MTNNAPQAGPADPRGAAPPGMVSLAMIYWIFFQVGALSFGGGLSAWLYRDTVGKRKLLTDADFISAMTLAQILPGVNMTNLSVYVGQRLRGLAGSVTAVVALISLPFLSILFLASIYETYIAHNPTLQLFLDGVAVSAVGLLLSMAVRAVRVTRMQGSQLVIMGLVAFAVGVLRWPMIPVILVLAPVSVALVWPWGQSDKGSSGDAENA
jgi:chromate transporter